MTHTSLKRMFAPALLLVTLGAGCIQFTGSAPAGNDGGVFKSANKGVNWTQKSAVASVGAPQSIAALNITGIFFDPSDQNALYAGTQDKGLFYSYARGESWMHADALGPIYIRSVAVNPGDKCMLFVATGNRVARSADCARTWSNTYLDARNDTRITGVVVDFFNNANVLASTSSGDFLKSTDQGASWSNVKRFDNEITQFMMSSADSRVIYVVTKSKGLWRTTDGGANWTDLTPKLGNFAGALDNMILVEDRATPNALLLASNYGLVRSTDGGDSWKAVPLLTPPGSTIVSALAVNPKSSNEIYYSTSNTLYRTIDGGAKWITARLPTSRTATELVVDPNDPNTVYMATTAPQKKQGL